MLYTVWHTAHICMAAALVYAMFLRHASLLFVRAPWPSLLSPDAALILPRLLLLGLLQNQLVDASHGGEPGALRHERRLREALEEGCVDPGPARPLCGCCQQARRQQLRSQEHFTGAFFYRAFFVALWRATPYAG